MAGSRSATFGVWRLGRQDSPGHAAHLGCNLHVMASCRQGSLLSEECELTIAKFLPTSCNSIRGGSPERFERLAPNP